MVPFGALVESQWRNCELMKPRTLTVSCLMQERGRSDYVPVPFVRLTGLWLGEAGFKPGDAIKVQVKYHRLVITKLMPDGNPSDHG